MSKQILRVFLEWLFRFVCFSENYLVFKYALVRSYSPQCGFLVFGVFIEITSLHNRSTRVSEQFWADPGASPCCPWPGPPTRAQGVAPAREQACAISHFLFSVASRLGMAGVIFSNCL